jgi:outer membrane protein
MRTLVIVLLVVLSTGAMAQAPAHNQKIGFADPAYIFGQLPEYKQIENQMKTHGDQLQAQAKAKYTEYETKLRAYQQGAATMLDAVRRDKETELTQLQENITKFQEDARASLAKKEQDLMTPINSKIGNAIEEVAKENGFTFIINPQIQGSIDILLYGDEKYDISTLVLKKLGVTPTAPPPSK